MFFKFLISILLFVAAIDLTLACNGYKLKIKKIVNCAGNDAIISVGPDFSMELNKNCELVPSGTVTSKGFSTAVAKYSVKKKGFRLKRGTVDACAVVENLDSKGSEFLRMLGMPEQCPMEEQQVSVDNNKMDVSKYKGKLHWIGTIFVEVDVTHDTGKSCFKILLKVHK